MKKGISLVALIITIIVLIILTGTVIITMNDGNIIGKSKEAVFKNDVRTFQEDLRNKILNKQLESGGTLDRGTVDAIYGGENEANIKNWINSYSDKYENKFAVEGGELVYIVENLSEEEIVWASDLGLNEKEIDAVQSDFEYSYSGTSATVTRLSVQGEGKIASNVATLRIPDIVTNNEQNYTVTSIGEYAFMDCEKLKLKSLPSGLTSIDQGAFIRCYNLELSKLPDGLTSIGQGAFEDSQHLNFTELPSGITVLSAGVFKNTGISLKRLPDGLTTIEAYALYNANLENLGELPNSLTSIADSAFNGASITSLRIPWERNDPRSVGFPWGLDENNSNKIHFLDE